MSRHGHWWRLPSGLIAPLERPPIAGGAGYALVGSLGGVVQSASGAAVSGLAWGQTPTAGNLLICWWNGQGASTSPSSPGNFNVGQVKTSTTQCGTVFYQIAAGGDAVPTFGAITSSVQTVMLGEFSGNWQNTTNFGAAIRDQIWSTGSTGSTSPLSTTAAAADVSSAELVVYSCGNMHSAGVTDSCSTTVNGIAGNDTTNNGTSTVNHYDFGWLVTSSNAGADVVALTRSTTSLTSCVISAASFKLPPTILSVGGLSWPLSPHA